LAAEVSGNTEIKSTKDCFHQQNAKNNQEKSTIKRRYTPK
jgi:hypothetical protein